MDSRNHVSGDQPTGSARVSETYPEPMREASLEAARLKALQRYRILDTPSETAFDDFTRLAAYICNTPIAILSLIDTDRQWFKSRVGLTVQQTERKIAFCNRAIRAPFSSQPFLVPDAQADVRFADNPLVTSDPHIRFYAGAPIITPDGHALGTLCVIDHVPREITPAQSDALSALSRQVMHLMERRHLTYEQRQLVAERRAAEKTLYLAQQQIVERTADVQTQFSQALALDALSGALDAKDAYTNDHSTRVCTLAVALAQAVCPGDTDFARRVQVAARLHDIGKIGVPEAVIQKPGRLEPHEFQMIQQHPEIGNHILLPLIKDEAVLAFVRHHHERWDGMGYPAGLAGTAIPLGARVLAVADAFDAMTSTRPYRAAFSGPEALETLVAGAGQQWDADIVNALIHHLATAMPTSSQIL